MAKQHPQFIEIIKSPHIIQLVKRWIKKYEKNSGHASTALLTMLVEACGAKYHITDDNTDIGELVAELVNLERNGKVEDYRSSKKEFKIFKDNLVHFWDCLVVECQNGPLFDQLLFNKCMDYMIELSHSTPQVYRQVATLMGLQLVTSFTNVAKMLGSQKETTQRQLNAEKKKRTDGRHVESLQKRLSMTNERIKVIEEMMHKLFTGLFEPQLRDGNVDIRISCIQSLGVWILSYPTLFLQNSYLKYLGMKLDDEIASVRKACVLALQNLYEVDENVPSLGPFTKWRYKEILKLARDTDISVAVCAVGLVKQLLRHQLVPDKELGSLYGLLIHETPGIRRAVGALVYDHLIAQKFNSSQSTGDGDDSSKVHLSRMLQILRKFSTDQILFTYVIDDVWEYMDAMKDWKCIISMLLDDKLSDVDATSLIRLICLSVEKAVGERIVSPTDNRKKNYTSSQQEMIENNRHDITIAMMKNYPQILRKFMADEAKVLFLVEIIGHMDLELYSLERQEQSFENVLKLIKEAFFKYSEKDALRSFIKAFNYCTTKSQGELQGFARNQLKQLENELIIKLISAMKEIADDDNENFLLENLKRLYEFQLSRQIDIDILYDDFCRILQRDKRMDDEVISFLLLNMNLHVDWSLHTILTSEQVSEAKLSSLLLKCTTLCKQLDKELEHFLCHPQTKGRKPGSQLACRVCTILAEIWCLFRKGNYASTELESLDLCPSGPEPILQKFWRTCEQELHYSDEREDKDVNKEYVEENNRNAVMIAAVKVVTNEAASEEHCGPEIISNFVMPETSVFKAVKHLIAVSWKKDGETSIILLGALKRAYQWRLEARSTTNDKSLPSKSFQYCKDLATHLYRLYVGVSQNKDRLDIFKIVSAGIEYAFWDTPKQLSVLDDAVLHFVSRLPTTDTSDGLKDVEKITENVKTDEDPSGRHPCYAVVDTLRKKDAKNEGLQDERDGITCPRKKQNLQGKQLFDENSSSEEEDTINESDQFAEGEEDEVPLIQSFKSSSKLRSLTDFRDEKQGQTRTGVSSRAARDLTTSRTSGVNWSYDLEKGIRVDGEVEAYKTRRHRIRIAWGDFLLSVFILIVDIIIAVKEDRSLAVDATLFAFSLACLAGTITISLSRAASNGAFWKRWWLVKDDKYYVPFDSIGEILFGGFTVFMLFNGFKWPPAIKFSSNFHHLCLGVSLSAVVEKIKKLWDSLRAKQKDFQSFVEPSLSSFSREADNTYDLPINVDPSQSSLSREADNTRDFRSSSSREADNTYGGSCCGLTGLLNRGNTCFMNSAIQCLVHTSEFARYFREDYHQEINKQNPLGTFGQLAIAFGELLRKLWEPGTTTVSPTLFREKFVRFAPRFSGDDQQDSQEFLVYLLDGLHEDLNRVIDKPDIKYKDAGGRPVEVVADEYWANYVACNDSVVVDLCHGQYKSTVICAACNETSFTFDPFVNLSLPLSFTSNRSMTVTIFTSDGITVPVSYTVSVPKQGHCRDLIQALAIASPLKDNQKILLAEIRGHVICRYLEDLSMSLASIRDVDHLAAYKIPNLPREAKMFQLIHRLREPGPQGEKKMKPYGTPLCSSILCTDEISSSHIRSIVHTLLSPMSIAKDVGRDSSQGRKSQMLLVFVGRNNVCVDISDGEKKFKYSSLSDSILVYIYWSKKLLKNYEMSILENLAEVSRYASPTEKAHIEHLSLGACLESFLCVEPLVSWKCPRCKAEKKAMKKLDLWRLPEVLIIHLKRFLDVGYFNHKLETFVNFPIHDFDLTNFVANKNNSERHLYELYALANHYGVMGKGHYTAHIKHEDKWYIFYDDHVSPMNEEDLKTSAAYVLFYRRSGEFSSSSTLPGT